MASIPQDFIDRLRSSTDIVSLVSTYVPLKASGKSFKGLCPFHSEKTPSFHVNPERQIFHCFGCQEGGDAFKFLMLYDKLSFVEAIEHLAARAGMRLPKTTGAARHEADRGVLMEIHRQAARYFRAQLDTPAGSGARAYIEARGISRETVERQGFGFAPDEWSGLLSHLTRRGIDAEAIARAGLVVPRKNSQGHYDRFRKRVMIPIRAESGQVVAFGGRILGDGEPKYLNSPESPIYNKSTLLYGFDVAKDAIRKEGSAILMEGYMDCIQAYQAGIFHAVACCGTSLTTGHARLLRRYTERIVVNFDPDPAGQRAARRSIDLLLEQGFEVLVMSLPGGKDPDGFIREDGPEAYRKLLARAPSFVDFLIRDASERYDVETPRGKAAFLDDVLPVIGKIPNRVERVGYIGPLAERAGISDQAVLSELRRHVETKAQRFQLPTPERKEIKLAERELIRFLVSTEQETAVLDELEDADIEGLATASILKAMKEVAASGELTSKRLMDRLESEAAKNQLTAILMEPSPLGPRQSPRDCLNGLRRDRLKRELSRLRRKLAHAADDDNLTAEILSLARRIETLGRVETSA
ncbi:MAG TPA: DNA primase [Vicinamibacteria bacterium]|nr:DNA primase [Vicinamibacteria bacterium]